MAVNDRSARWSLTATPLKCGNLLTRSSFFQKRKPARRRELGSALLQWPASKMQDSAVERQAVFVRKSARSANAGIGRGVRLARPSHKPRTTRGYAGSHLASLTNLITPGPGRVRKFNRT